MYTKAKAEKIFATLRIVPRKCGGGISRSGTLDCWYGEVSLHHGLAHGVHGHPGEESADGDAEYRVPLRRVQIHAAGHSGSPSHSRTHLQLMA